jgi:hypothetical protein
MTQDAIARVHYFEGQYLRRQDFDDEQAYHLAVQRRHNVAQHIWGILTGLELVGDQEGNLYLEGGVAADAFGRLLVLAERLPLGNQAFADLATDSLDFFLEYDRSSSDQAPLGEAACANGEASFYRWREQPQVTFQRAALPPVDRRSPPGVQPADRNFDATDVPFDDPRHRWPVFLGKVTYDPANPKQPYVVDGTGRPYAGLVGASVAAPSGRVRLQLGPERRNDPYQFAVFVPDDPDDPSPGALPRLAITAAGAVAVRGDTTIRGQLTVEGHALELQGAPDPQTAAPAQLYHVDAGNDQELRVELGAPGGDGPDRLVVGAWSEGADGQERFQACLTIANDCTVTIHGNLVVEGTLDNNAFASKPDVVDPGLGEEARRLAVASFSTGVAGASTVLEKFYRSPFPDDEEPPGPILFGGPLPALPPEASVRVAAATIAAHPDRAETFARLVRESNPEAADLLRDAFQPPAAPTQPVPQPQPGQGGGEGPT